MNKQVVEITSTNEIFGWEFCNAPQYVLELMTKMMPGLTVNPSMAEDKAEHCLDLNNWTTIKCRSGKARAEFY